MKIGKLKYLICALTIFNRFDRHQTEGEPIETGIEALEVHDKND